MLNHKSHAAAAARSNNLNRAALLHRAGAAAAALRVPASCIITVLFCATTTFAQAPIYNGNASNLANIVRAILLLAASMAAVLGVLYAIKAIKNLGSDKEWGNQAGAALLFFGLTTVIAVIWALAQGKVVDVGTNF
jgi:hypothetical protein